MKSMVYAALARWAERRPWMMLALGMLATLFAVALASRLELNMQFKNMMPQSHPTVQEYDRIVDQYASASSLIVVVRGQEQEMKRFADSLASELREMTQYIRRVDYRIDADFIGQHGFMLVKARDLKNAKGQFEDLGLLPLLAGINSSFEKTYVADSESISNGEKEDNAIRAIDGIDALLAAMESYVSDTETNSTAPEAVERFLIGDTYFVSPDKNMLLLFVQPTFTMNDVEIMVDAVNAVDSLIATVGLDYPSVDAGTTGTLALGRDEMVAVTADMYTTTIIAFVLIIGLFIMSFRMWVAPVLAGISLMVGITWAAGVSSLTVGSLNLMTSMFAVILIGLGIDYNIHIISCYTEQRAEGDSIAKALHLALTKTGNGIFIGSVSTALAFLTMLISENLGMKEFAWVAGLGVLCCMLSSLLILPSLLVVRDRLKEKKSQRKRELRSITYGWTGRMAEELAIRPRAVLLLAALITAALFYSALQIEFDYNYLNLEPKGLRSIELQDAVIDEYDVTPDMVLVTTGSVEEARSISESAKELGSVGMVTSVSDFVPSSAETDARLPLIREIRADLNRNVASDLSTADVDPLIDELYRIEDNLIELAQLAFVGGQDKVDRRIRALTGDLELPVNERSSAVGALVVKILEAPENSMSKLRLFQSAYEPEMRTTAVGMTSEMPISVADLPVDISNQFVSDDGSHYLVSIFPREQVWDFEFLGRFTDQMHRIDPRVTGLPPIFYVLIEYIAADGRTAAILALSVIFFLLWIDFRSFATAIMAMVTLAVGAIWMVGLMNLLGMKFNLVNTIGIPLILGIGIDDAVHILNRHRVEGPGKLFDVYASTGKAVILTSLTTMIAFGSLGFAVYRGLGSLGITLMIGVGTALLTTLLVLPAFLGLFDRRAERTMQRVPTEARKTTSLGMFVLAAVLSTSFLAYTPAVMAQETPPDISEIIRRIDANETAESSRSTGRQIIKTSSGSERILEMESYSLGQNEKTLTVYTGPARVRGDKILMLNDGDDIWFYTPKTDRVRHLASHARRQKVQGSEFAYEDMVSGNLEEDYRHRLLREEDLNGVRCYVIEAIPTDSGPSYSKLILWAEKERFVTRQIDFYEDDELLKRLITGDIRELSEHWIPFSLTMTNLRDGDETILEFDVMEINVDVDDGIFTTNSLGRR